jgi:uncharacterized protein (DUF2062 family)
MPSVTPLPIRAPFRLPLLLEVPWRFIAFQAVAQGVVVGAFFVFPDAKAAEKLCATEATAPPVRGPVIAATSAVLIRGEPLGLVTVLGVGFAVGGMPADVLFAGWRQLWRPIRAWR